MKIKLKLGVFGHGKELIIEPIELGYTEEEWEYMSDEDKHRIVVTFVNNIIIQPYWYLESFKTL